VDADVDTDPAVLAERDEDGVLTLTFNRPDRRNGWNEELGAAYYARLTEAADDPAVRAVVLTGAGKTFCPGADMRRLEGLSGEGQQAPHTPVDVPRRFPKPLIAAVNGGCAGIGLVQALFCHVRFAAEGVRFSTAFARRGLIAEYGLAWTLPRLIGTENALDLLLSARTFDAAEAHRLGLVSRVVPAADLLPAARAYAADLARNSSPRAMAVIAEQVRAAADSTYDEALERSYELMDRFVGSADMREGVASFVERRPARFAPLEPPD
jgi:enoyl-CoA hydratase/carnithine racemase